MNMKAIADIFPLRHWTLACGLLLALQSPAIAHAFLDHSEPRLGSTVTNPACEVKIWFGQELEPAFSSIEVKDAQAQQVDTKDVQVHKTAI
jgi:methionine-rich copper-binding protein CopC